ncbi:peptidylprolyl isomerase [Hephaestia sp. GCM10023244]|uniref:peptidylprolyl isomerase n=1 Tax=unclassified Hephaestia TaxID=2631281 RepID=UPI002077562F|nr:peptidylprolyl isomerase [Hephaestia sp. MAHUQ-44]MCM8730041.1 peptidylprolyl isomerase [Hephaestia sp. MAHUQ-44]
MTEAAAEPDADLPRVAIQTSAGPIVVALDTERAPITANNFLAYVDQHKLDGVTFYRTVKVQDRFGFVQFGVNGDPVLSLPPIRHEPTSETGVHHVSGTLSIARLEPGSARGEFTIMVGDQRPGFDADPAAPGDKLGYAAFGHVVEGMDVVERIMDAPVDPAATVRGAFKGEVPATPVKVISATRLKP